MKYKESGRILEEFKIAKKVVITCHYHPDPDSVASVLSLKLIFDMLDLGHDITLLSPSRLSSSTHYLPNSNEIKVVDFSKFNFTDYDLLITPDSGSWNQVTGSTKLEKPHIKCISIDHHRYHENYGDINLVDVKSSSACETIYLLLQDWEMKVNKKLATALLTGIIGDTGAFQYDNTKPRTLEISSELLKNGADHKNIIINSFRSYDLDMIRFWGLFLSNLQVDSENRFIWIAVDYDTFSRHKNVEKGKSLVASIFARSIEDTDFGIVMVEDKKNVVDVSLRERNGFNVLNIARELGGGGHRSSAGARMEGIDFNKAVKKVLKVARKYARKNSRNSA